MNKNIAFIICVIVLIVPSLCFGQEQTVSSVDTPDVNTPAVKNTWRDYIPAPYAGEGLFVEGPAIVGGSAGVLGGFAVGIIPAMGAGVIGATIDIGMLVTGNGPTNYSFGLGERVHGFFVKSGMYTVLYIAGAPFYIVKKILYDFPIYIYNSINGAPSKSADKPDLNVPLPNRSLNTSRNETASFMTATLC